MGTDHDGASVSGVGPGADVAVEPKSVPRQVAEQLRRRWKTVGAVAVTALTTAVLHDIDGGWSKDATAFALLTAALFVYTAATLYTDLELD